MEILCCIQVPPTSFNNQWILWETVVFGPKSSAVACGRDTSFPLEKSLSQLLQLKHSTYEISKNV